MPSLHPGGLLARRYRLIDQIGAGGMSVIWRAHDEVLDRVVALKVLAASLAADARFRSMVRQEARAAAALVHPQVTAVHDYGEEIDPDGTVTAFVVMELLSGEVLESRLTQGPLRWDHAVRVCAEVAEALAAAHRLSIVHRDVTPANIMLTALGAKVLDFGIATHIGAPDEDEEGDTFGTPAYVAPERLDGTPAQPATDVYALGVLLYETVTGRVPYPADTWDDLTEALAVSEAPEPPAAPGLPPEVAAICLRCLDRNPRQRPTAYQVGERLRALLPAESAAASHASTVILPAAVPPFPTVPAAPEPVPVPARATEPAPAAQRSGRALVVAVASLAVVAVAVLAGSMLSPEGDREVPPAAAPTSSAPAATGAATGSATPHVDPTTAPQEPRAAETPIADPPASSPTVTAVPTVREAMAALGHVLDDGVESGDIAPDAAQDLRNLVRNLETNIANGAVDLPAQVRELHVKVGDRTREGLITADYATEIGAALDTLATAT